MESYIPSNLRDLSVDSILQLLAQSPPWWVYVLAALIPLSLFFLFREGMCWFWKINRIAGRLERIEALLIEIAEQKVEPQRPSPPPKGPPVKMDEPYKL